MVAIIVQAVWKLGQTAFRRWRLALVGLACFVATVAGALPIAVLLGAGGVVLVARRLRARSATAQGFAWPAVGLAATSAGSTAGVGLTSIWLVFLKLGVVVFGSGYVLLVFLKADLVDRLHWVTQSQLLDAVTAGQITPGPVFATATFLGYLVHGWAGAGVATLAIFLPSFAMAGVVGALAGRIRSSVSAAAFLDGVNAAAVALMASVALTLGRATLVDGWTWALGLASVALLARFRVNATWLLLGGAAMGVLLRGV
jgi:chromate transporter